MAIIQGPTMSFKAECLQGIHDLTTDTLKIALYSSTASLGPQTTEYTTDGEVTGTGYSAGGATLSGVTVSSNTTIVYVDISDVSWPASEITARGAMIYNSSKLNRSVWIFNFGIDRLSNASTGNFELIFPPGTPDTAIIRITN